MVDDDKRREGTQGQDKKPLGNLVRQAIDTVVQLVWGALKIMPWWAGALLVLSALGTILCLVFGFIFYAGGDTAEAFRLVIASFILLLVFGVLILISQLLVRSERPGMTSAVGTPAPTTASTTVWSRVVPKLPISDNDVQDLEHELKSIRDKAVSWLRKHYSNIEDDQVRANVFFPDYTAATTGDVCKLSMYVRVNMERHPDRDVHFRPRQGLTGKVFAGQQRSCAKTFQTREGEHEWDDMYELTEEQKRTLHPDLRWIVSFPLKILEEGRRKAAGVLNVDGLRMDVPWEKLESLLFELAVPAMDFVDTLADLPKVRVAINLEDPYHV